MNLDKKIFINKNLDLGTELDIYQLEAVKALGNVLVIAGPGAGKTRVLTYRIYNLIMNHGVPPDYILALTFTKKAAEEMKSRIRQLTQKTINASTFHSFTFSEMKKYPNIFNIDEKVTLLDEEDALDLIKPLVGESRGNIIDYLGKNLKEKAKAIF